jgi:predicted outer membrane repeat protein
VTMTNSTVSGNSAAKGGGIAVSDGTLSVVNSVFVGNSAQGNGGGILSDASTLTLTNSTVVANVSDTKGGGVYSSGGMLAVGNSILAMNRAPTSADLYGILGVGSGGVLLGMDPGFVRNPSDGGDGWGDDPTTADVDEGANDDFGNLRLRENGPAVNAGINGLAVDAGGGALATDRDGKQRVIYGTVDIGAYEFCLVGDADYSGVVDGGDAAVMAAHWGQGEMHLGDGDFNGDGRVNAVDAAILAANWGATFSPAAEGRSLKDEGRSAVAQAVPDMGPFLPRSSVRQSLGGDLPVSRSLSDDSSVRHSLRTYVAPCASVCSVVKGDRAAEATDAALAEEYGPSIGPAVVASGRVAWSHVLARRKSR